MKKPSFGFLHIFATSLLLLLFGGCEYLFYSPAFMPAVSETKLRVMAGNYEEYYDDERSAYGTWSFTDPSLQFDSPFTTGTEVPAMRSLRIGNEMWHGVSEFLGMFFSSAIPVYGGSGNGSGAFHGYGVSFAYNSYNATGFDLPFSAPKGINGNGRTTSLSGNLAVVEISADGLKDALRGDGTFVFGNGPSDYGLLYLVFYHDSGLTTVVYQHKSSISAGSFFPEGRFTFIINVFPD